MVSLTKLLGECGGETAGVDSSGVEVRDVQLDSRRVTTGDLFVAVMGSQADGVRFVEGALDAGACAVLSAARLDEILERRVGWTNWIHPEPRRVAGQAAALAQGNPSRELVTVGITGTNGKTTVAHLVGQLLELEGRKPGIVGTVEVRLFGRPARAATHTTPDAPELQRICREQVNAGGDTLVIEASSHGLDQDRLSGFELDVAVLTNISTEHMDYHLNMDSYADAKARLFAHLRPGGTAIINLNDAYAPRMLRAAEEVGARVVTYGTDTLSDLSASGLRAGPGGTNLTLEGMGIPRTGFQIPLVGRHNVENVLASLCVVLTLGASPIRASEGLASLTPPPGRLEPVDVGDRGFRVFVDYAHTPDALENVLGALRQTLLAESGEGARLLCVFGCGGERDREKRAPMGSIVGALSDVAYVTSDNPRGEEPEGILRDIVAGMSDAKADVVTHTDRRVAIRAALKEARPGDLILVAGKGHESWQYLRNERRPFNDRLVLLEELP
ncbi:MAG: UDP-N-acetylmuramoyl-L-alanyl-D-glutamate--2,6-diaminopimelate ligase [Planctomycetota bacterium]